MAPADSSTSDALGHLEPQVDRVEAGAGEDLAHRLRQVAVRHLAGREVDGDVEWALVGAQVVPAERLAAGRLLHPAADRLDQAAVLGDRDELAGVEQAALGVVPAHQRLDADDLAAAQSDHRLVVQFELLALERVAQLALGLEPAHRARPHLGVEDLAAPAAALLGPVHRRVGVADQQLGVGRLAACRPGDGDADAGGDEMVGAAHRVGLREGARHPVGDRQRLVLVGEPVDEDAELVAAEAGDDVAGAQVGAQARRHRPQQVVAGVVADAVVDQLEVIKVEEEDADRRARGDAAAQRVA